MDYKDYYKTLGLQRGASEKEVRSAYRRLARQYHPDVNPSNPDAAQKFREVNEAYEVLSDPEKRARYDRYGTAWERARASGSTAQTTDFGRWFSGTSGAPRGSGASDATGFSDFFRTLFSNGRTGTAERGAVRARRGTDVEQDVEITVEEAFHGAQRVLQLGGTQECARCGGRGIVQSQLCPECGGRGEAQQEHRIEARIPAGLQHGSRIRIAGKGGQGTNGGPPGDLYLRVRIRPDDRFQVSGNDIRVTVKADLYTCLLGGEVDVPTPIGKKLSLTVPAGTPNGKAFRLKGQGMPAVKGDGRGDLYAVISVDLPEQLNPEEQLLFQKLRDLRGAKGGT